jgi:hypothetical protein
MTRTPPIERKLQVEIDGKRSYIPEPIPNRAAYGQVYRFQLYRKPQTVDWMNLGYVCIDGAQRTRHLLLTNYTILELW